MMTVDLRNLTIKQIIDSTELDEVKVLEKLAETIENDLELSVDSDRYGITCEYKGQTATIKFEITLEYMDGLDLFQFIMDEKFYDTGGKNVTWVYAQKISSMIDIVETNFIRLLGK